MHGWYELVAIPSGEFFFTLKYKDGTVLLESSRYADRFSAAEALIKFRNNCSSVNNFERKAYPFGKMRFTLRDMSDTVLQHSSVYGSKNEIDKAIATINSVGAMAALKMINHRFC